jgi:hypothetical protein
VAGPTVIAIDWSGRDGPQQVHHIRAAAFTSTGIDLWPEMRREGVIERVIATAPPLVVGFDFSFGYPAWVAACYGLLDGIALWPTIAEHAEDWLRDVPHPFYAKNGVKQPADIALRRRCEETLKAKSTFQLAGGGHVGTGTLRGIPHLMTLRDAGFTIWPFEDTSERTVVEIYPRPLLAFGHSVPVPSDLRAAMDANDNTRDAVGSACVMWEHRESFADLRAATDPVTLLEGDVWMPPTVGNRRAS